MQNPASASIVLASSSSYRRGLLDRFLDDYETVSPNVDETDDGSEVPEHFAARLAREKAEAASSGYRDSLIIGADQIAVLEGQVLGKPGDHQRAVKQLLAAAGKSLQFLTAVCVLDPAGRTDMNTSTAPRYGFANSICGSQRPICGTTNPTTVPAVSKSRAPDSYSSNQFRRTIRPR